MSTVKNTGKVCYGCGSTENIEVDSKVDGERFCLCGNCNEESRIMAADFVRYELNHGEVVEQPSVDLDALIASIKALNDYSMQAGVHGKRTLTIEFTVEGRLGDALSVGTDIIRACEAAHLAGRIETAYIKDAPLSNVTVVEDTVPHYEVDLRKGGSSGWLPIK